jgi:release factor glutamine methyltransferase
MQTNASQLQHARTQLAPIAGDLAALEARLLAQAAWGVSAETLVRNADDVRDDDALQMLVNRRLQNEPVAQILGYKDFWRDRFAVSPDVLTPRADSEVMIETLLRHRLDKNAPLRIMDLGTGSGCLLLSALREYTNATGLGVDQSAAALAIAVKNAAVFGMQQRCKLLQGNWCSNLDGTFDVVLANPPYIPTNDIAVLDADVRLHEPHAALDGGTDGLDCYRSILQQIMPHLKPAALLIFEVGQGQDEDLVRLGTAQGLRHVETAADLAGILRVVAFTNGN